MVIIKKLYKEYISKSKTKTQALNNISVEIGDKGMIFILGKSGSGKSTLINIIAGLDCPTSGEIVINDINIAEFKSSELDAYRNTCIGCVFQEYNLLNDYNVFDNIALAVRLNNKVCKDEINDLVEKVLTEVNILDLARRMPSELSGGQKQRVAIARALVKNTDILIADEPTGALDSENGSIVISTLKEISKSKLVIVVSHDKLLANQYADRIIELENGEIIADYSNNVLDSASGIDYVDVQFENDNNVKNQPSEVIIEEKQNIESTSLAIISKPKRSNACTPYRKSSLPFTSALKLAFKSFNVKKGRLIATLMLCIIAFTSFGLVDTMASYDYDESVKQAILIDKDNIHALSFRSTEQIAINKQNVMLDYGLTFDDKQNIETEIGQATDGVLNKSVPLLNNFLDKEIIKDSHYYGKNTPQAIMMTEDRLNTVFGDNIIGRVPENSSEIMISKYIYEHFMLTGYDNRGDIFNTQSVKIPADEMPSMSSFVNDQNSVKSLVVHNSSGFLAYNIVGIIDTGINDDGHYENLANGKYTTTIKRELVDELENSYHNLVYFYDGALSNNRKFSQSIPNFTMEFDSITDAFSDHNMSGTQRVAAERMAIANDVVCQRFDGSTAPLKDGEVMIHINQLDKLGYEFNLNPEFSEQKFSLFDSHRMSGQVSQIEYTATTFVDYLRLTNERIITQYVIDNTPKNAEFSEAMVNRYNDWTYDNIADVTELTPMQEQFMYYEYLLLGGDKFTSDDVLKICQNELIELINSNGVLSNFSTKTVLSRMTYTSNNYTRDNKEIQIVGFYFPSQNLTGADYEILMMSNNDYDNINGINQVYKNVLVPTESLNSVANVINFSQEVDENGMGYSIFTRINAPVQSVDSSLKTIVPILLWISIGLMLFSLLLLGNYLFVAILDKNYDIGIIKSLGASNVNVFSIFFLKSLIIASIIIALTLIMTPIVCLIINLIVYQSVPALVFGLRQVGILTGIILAISAFASMLPIVLNIKKSPHELISKK